MQGTVETTTRGPNQCGSETTILGKGQTRAYLNGLAGSLKVPFEFALIQQRPGNKDKGKTINKFGTLQDLYAWLCEHNEVGYSVFVTVNETDGAGRKAENIKRIRAVWNDCDHGIPDSYPLAPTFRVNSSEGKVQDYWLPQDNMPFDKHSALLDTLVAKHNGDKGAKGLPRVLRVPGFLNWKYGKPWLVQLEIMSGDAYTTDEIVKAFPAIGAKSKIVVAGQDFALPALLSRNTTKYRMSLDELASDLGTLSADPREDWISYGIAIKRDFGEDGWSVWKKWSETSELYDAHDARVKWDGFDVSEREGQITCGTIRHLAKEARRTAEYPATEDGSITDCDAIAAVYGDGVKDHRGNAINPASIKNIVIFLKDHVIKPWLNEFDHSYYVRQAGRDVKLTDEVALDLRMRMHAWGCSVGKELCTDTLMWVAGKITAHPVKEYLLNVKKWDETPRIDNWLATCCGAEPNRYHQLVGSKFLIAAVRRVMQPGCKFDAMLVLEGEQNAGKSSVPRTLASPKWFTDGVGAGSSSKETIELTSGKWLVECAELAGMSKRDVNEVKQALSKQVDLARLSYDRFAKEVPRQFVFFGTTNNTQYLSDITGGRRFWCVKTGTIDLVALERNRDQLWAEAVVREKRGERIYLKDDEYVLAVTEQAKREVDDPTAIFVEELLAEFEHGVVRKSDMFKVLGYGDASKGGAYIGAKLGPIMARLDWIDAGKVKHGGERPRCFTKPTIIAEGCEDAPSQRFLKLKDEDGTKRFMWGEVVKVE